MCVAEAVKIKGNRQTKPNQSHTSRSGIIWITHAGNARIYLWSRSKAIITKLKVSPSYITLFFLCKIFSRPPPIKAYVLAIHGKAEETKAFH